MLQVTSSSNVSTLDVAIFDFIFREVLLLQIVSELVIVPELPFYILCKVALEHEGNYKEIDASYS
jgi:hypothetical protein